MACPSCQHTMQGLGEGIFWCPRCGSIRYQGLVSVPCLVHRVRELHDAMKAAVGFSAWDISKWNELGLLESIDLPGNRLYEGGTT